MAVRKGSKKKSSGKKARKVPSLAILFWLGFAIVIFGVFLYNRETISNSIQTIQTVLRGQDPPARPAPIPDPPVVERTPAPAEQNEQPSSAQQQSAALTETAPIIPPVAVQEMRERALYFTQVDRDGTILRVRVNRSLPLSSSPMTDVLHALIAGPNEEERQRGLVSLIPPDTQILSVAIRDDTAFINFNDDFQFNTFGVEGYAAQLRELVFTVTEFPNIRDVQILIEGRMVNFLGEGIWIGSPLSREMF